VSWASSGNKFPRYSPIFPEVFMFQVYLLMLGDLLCSKVLSTRSACM
jgi:hypothetical protein